MRLTLYTDYTLRVLMYLSLKHAEGGVATIDEIARAYGISHNHLTKIVNEFAQRGIVETLRGRAGGVRLARDPSLISIGEVVRMAEKDFSLAQCHDESHAGECAIFLACNLKGALSRALAAFMRELDAMTLADAVADPGRARPLLGLQPPGRTIPIASPPPKPSRAA